ncbi:MAG: DUF3179 domain-containing (seleno)protein, partial [Chitinophagaceae bacterium]
MKYAKSLFLISLVGLMFFEVLNVYLIMPMPGSQEMKSIDAAYFLYKWRWIFRIFFLLILVYGLIGAKWERKWSPLVILSPVAMIIYFLNFQMAADHMFYQPSKLMMVQASESKVEPQRLIIGIVLNNETRAYPIQFLGYHHQVMDTIGGKPVMITYCTVCRTGRIYEPKVNGHGDKFRLVGMDLFNAMFEDESTKSWWRQATGEAVAGKLKGSVLPEILSTQTSLGKWLELYPNSKIMQADPAFKSSYDSLYNYEKGLSRKKLTGTDSLSWQKKSWVIGVKLDGQARAYDWNRLKKDKLIEDTLGGKELFILLAADSSSFFAFEKSGIKGNVKVEKDTIILGKKRFRLDGVGIDTSMQL